METDIKEINNSEVHKIEGYSTVVQKKVKEENATRIIALGLILPTKILKSKFFFWINLKILNPQIFWDKSEKIWCNLLVQLAGQISENNIQEFLVGSHYP